MEEACLAVGFIGCMFVCWKLRLRSTKTYGVGCYKTAISGDLVLDVLQSRFVVMYRIGWYTRMQFYTTPVKFWSD